MVYRKVRPQINWHVATLGTSESNNRTCTTILLRVQSSERQSTTGFAQNCSNGIVRCCGSVLTICFIRMDEGTSALFPDPNPVAALAASAALHKSCTRVSRTQTVFTLAWRLISQMRGANGQFQPKAPTYRE